MRNVVHIVRARPNFMKAAPVVAASADLGDEPRLIHTGQHYDSKLSDVFFADLGMPQPDQNLGVGSGSHAQQTAALMTALEKALLESDPPMVVVYGDINSTLAASVVAAKLDIPVAHVEAGLRSFDRTMPEEINRVVTDALSQMHFVTSPEAMAHLANEGIPAESMHFVGNPMIDSLLAVTDLASTEDVRQRLDLAADYGVVTLHRPANVDDLDVARRMADGLSRVARRLPLVFPVHPRGRENLERVGLHEADGIEMIDPLGYLDFVALLKGARLVLTDSGGIQEETTVLAVPCLTLRPNTERPITISMGTNRLVGDDPELIESAANEALERPAPATRPPLWDGQAGSRIAATLNTA